MRGFALSMKGSAGRALSTVDLRRHSIGSSGACTSFAWHCAKAEGNHQTISLRDFRKDKCVVDKILSASV